LGGDEKKMKMKKALSSAFFVVVPKFPCSLSAVALSGAMDVVVDVVMMPASSHGGSPQTPLRA